MGATSTNDDATLWGERAEAPTREWLGCLGKLVRSLVPASQLFHFAPPVSRILILIQFDLNVSFLIKYIRNCIISVLFNSVCPPAHFACPVLILPITRCRRYVPLN